ncbi:MAG: hypothetical protein FWG45_01165 [Oscillospiraceae bacterium]|nr:hypothetical protein [Oscillospiraceae bacterium]
MEWFNNAWATLDIAERIMYIIAIPSSLFLILQTIMIIVGGDGDGGGDGGSDFDTDLDGGGSGEFGVASMFTLQGVMSFLCAMGWGSLFLYSVGVPLPLTLIAAFLFGVAVMYILARVMLALNKLAQSGTLDVDNLVGNMGSVYLTIPPKGEGKGKVMVQTSERLVEFDAVGESETAIANNTSVRVIDILGENVLVVEVV